MIKDSWIYSWKMGRTDLFKLVDWMDCKTQATAKALRRVRMEDMLKKVDNRDRQLTDVIPLELLTRFFN